MTNETWAVIEMQNWILRDMSGIPKNSVVAIAVIATLLVGGYGLFVWLPMERTFLMQRASGGPSNKPGDLVYVLLTERLPTGKSAMRVILEDARIVDCREDPDSVDGLTLRLSYEQILKLEDAQRRGSLQYALRRPPEPLVDQAKQWLGFEKRKITLKDIAKGQETTIP